MIRCRNNEFAVVLIYFKKRIVNDVQRTPLMPFNELLGTLYIFHLVYNFNNVYANIGFR